MELTPKQEKFCIEYHKCGNQRQAYCRAYDAKNMKPATIDNEASKLLHNPKITMRLRELSQKSEDAAIADAQEIKKYLTQVLRGEINEECVTVEGTGEGCSVARIIEKQVTPKDRIKAGETLAKMMGEFGIRLDVSNTPVIVDDI